MQLTVRELTADEYPLWDKLVAISPQRSIFAQRWWMEIVTQGQVRLYACCDEHENIVAGLPVWPCTTLGVRRLRQPPLTPYWGPILQPQQGKYATQLSAETDILQAFARTLSTWPDVTIAFHPSLQNWLPFYWTGYTQSTRYTYRIDNLAESLPSGKGLHRSIRNALNRAESNGLRVRPQVAPELIAEMSRLSLARQDVLASTEIRAFWPELSKAALARQCLYNAIAVDTHGAAHAGYAIVWDDRFAYDIYGGGDPQFRESGGGTLALQHLLTIASTVAPHFDFEGSMLENVGRFYRQFGGVLTPYLVVSRASSHRLNTARAVQSWLHHRYQHPKSPRRLRRSHDV